MNHQGKYRLLTILWIFILTANGTPSFSAVLSDPPLQGAYHTYFPDGKKQMKGFYFKGEKHKRWVYYDAAGRVTRKEQWKHGELQWTAFYENGRIARTIDKYGKISEKPNCGCK